MNIKNRIGKLEKTKNANTLDEIHVAIIHTCPDDPDYVIIDGERMTRKENERRDQALEASGGKIRGVGFDLEKV